MWNELRGWSMCVSRTTTVHGIYSHEYYGVSKVSCSSRLPTLSRPSSTQHGTRCLACVEHISSESRLQCQTSLNRHDNSEPLMQHVYTLLQRAQIMGMLGEAYEEALQDMISEMWSTSDETAWPDQA